MELILLHKNTKLKKQRDQYKRERDSLLKDIEFLHQLRKGDCSALDTLKAGNNHLIYERDELNEKLNKECNDNYKLEGQLHDMTKQRDELIKDVEKLREELRMHVQCNDELGRVNKLKDKTISELRVISNNYTNLTEHIRDKAENNPSEHRYFRLVHFIDDLEADNRAEG